MDGYILRMCGTNKSFFGVSALKNAQLEVFPGKAHALLEENGADKPISVKILSGAYGWEDGDIRLGGRELAPMTLEEALDTGISVIYQEFNLVPDLPVYESILIGKEHGQGALVDHKRAIKEAEGYMRRVGLKVSPRTLARELSVAQKQLVEMTKAVSNHVRILVLDESTVAITDKETDMLFGIIRRPQKEKIGTIYISHRTGELSEIGDRCTVIRDGEYIGTVRPSEPSEDGLTKMTVGRMVNLGKIANETVDMNRVVLEVESLRYKGFLKDISSELRRGEILGFTGLVGAGRTEAAKCMIGAYRKNGGIATHRGEILSNNLSRSTEKGVVYLNEDRKDEGLVFIRPTMDNVILPNLGRLAKPFIRRKEVMDHTEDHIKSLRIRIHTHLTEVRDLSGGNRQEVAITKWLYSNTDVYIFDEPTGGIGMGTRDEIYSTTYDLVNRGASTIMISSDLVEVLKMCGRVTVMRKGVLEVILDNDPDLTQGTILKYTVQGGI